MFAGLITASNLMRPWVGERVRLAGLKAAHPQRPRGRCLARDRRSGELALGVTLATRLGLVLKGPQQAGVLCFDLDSHRRVRAQSRREAASRRRRGFLSSPSDGGHVFLVRRLRARPGAAGVT